MFNDTGGRVVLNNVDSTLEGDWSVVLWVWTESGATYVCDDLHPLGWELGLRVVHPLQYDTASIILWSRSWGDGWSAGWYQPFTGMILLLVSARLWLLMHGFEAEWVGERCRQLVRNCRIWNANYNREHFMRNHTSVITSVKPHWNSAGNNLFQIFVLHSLYFSSFITFLCSPFSLFKH
jgi:hypothetical protein